MASRPRRGLPSVQAPGRPASCTTEKNTPITIKDKKTPKMLPEGLEPSLGRSTEASAHPEANVTASSTRKGRRRATNATSAPDASTPIVSPQPAQSITLSSETKAALVLRLLRRECGATLPEITTATGWQSHSVRGFLSGTVRKKLGLNLVSEVRGDGVRRYRVDEYAKADPAGRATMDLSALDFDQQDWPLRLSDEDLSRLAMSTKGGCARSLEAKEVRPSYPKASAEEEAPEALTTTSAENVEEAKRQQIAALFRQVQRELWLAPGVPNLMPKHTRAALH